MARRSVVRRPIISRSNRLPQWISLSLGSTGIAADAAVLLATFNAVALLLRPFTIIRTRLIFNVISDQQAASEAPRGALGMIVVTEDAAAAGVTAIPDAMVDTEAAFFVWQPFSTTFDFISSVGTQSPADREYVIDSKAMRKVGPSEDLAIVIEEVDAVGVIISLTGWMLVKLH